RFERKIEKRFLKRLTDDPRYMGTELEMKEESQQRAKKMFVPLRHQAKTYGFVNVMGIYRRLFSNQVISKDLSDVGAYTLHRLERNQLLFEDVTPFMYVKQMVLGI